MLTPCKDIKPLGGKYRNICKIFDGHKYVCIDKLLEDVQKNRVSSRGSIIWRLTTCYELLKMPLNQLFYFQCLIYTFGINKDWTFENTVTALGELQQSSL